MVRPSSDESDPDVARLVRVDEIVTAAMERARSGQRISIDAIVAEHPDLAEELGAALEAVASMERTVARAEGESLEMPDRIGPYEVVRELGRGGMGIVYEAHDRSLDRRVALKLLPPSISSAPSFLERFRREAHAAARLEHPNVVPIYGVDQADGHDFLAMKFVDGHGIDELLNLYARSDRPFEPLDGDASDVDRDQRRALRLAGDLATGRLGAFDVASDSSASLDVAPLDDGEIPSLGRAYHRNVARIGLAVADALAYAHARGVLHRDIKPGNVLIDRRGGVWVTDFGLAKLEESEDITREGDLVGTLRYMAPEHFEGHAESRSDVYALGLVLYEMLTLQRALKADSRAELVREILYVVPRSPDQVRAVVPQDLARIVMKAIAKLPQERYRTAQAMAADLRAYLEGRPIAAREPSVLYLTRVTINRNRPLFVAIAALLLALVVGAVLYVAQLDRSRRAETTLAYRANLAAASASLEKSDVPSARRHLSSCPPSRRRWEWEHLEASLDRSLRTIASVGTRVLSLEDVGDAYRIVHNQGLVTVAGDGERTIELPGGGQRTRTLVGAWPVDDGWLCFRLYSGFLRCGPEGVPEDAPIGGAEDEAALAGIRSLSIGSYVIAADFAPDAGVAVAAELDGKMYVVDTEELSVIAEVPTGQTGVDQVLVSRDGRRAWTASRNGSVREWDLGTLTARTVFDSRASLFGVSLRRDERRLAVACEDHSVHVVPLDGDDADAYQLIGHEGPVSCVAFSPDGSMLVSCGSDKAVRVWDLRTRKALYVLTGHAREVATIAFNDAGDRFVTGSRSGTVKEWHIGPSGGRTTVRGHLADVTALDHAAAGDRFATGARDSTIRVTDADSLRLDAILIGHRSEVNGLVWHGADRRILGADRRGYFIDWDVDSAAARWSIRLEGVGARPALAPDGEVAYLGSYGGEVVRARLEDGAELARARLDGLGVRSVAVTPDGGRVLVGTLEGWLLALDGETLAEVERTKRHEDRITRTLFDPTGRVLATSSHDGTVALSAARTLAVERRVRLGGEGNAWDTDGLDGACFSPDGRLLAVASNSWLIRLLDVASCDVVLDLEGHRDWVRRVAFSPDGRTLVSTGSYASVRVWDTRTTPEAERAFDSRVDLEGAGRAVVESWLGGSILDLQDIEEALARVDGMSGGHVELQRATRSVLHQERARHLRRILERRLVERWDGAATDAADSYFDAWARRMEVDGGVRRLAALSAVVKGRGQTAAEQASRARDQLGDAGETDPVLALVELRLAMESGEEARVVAAEERLDAALASADVHPIDRRTARLGRDRVEGLDRSR
ncbi:MAG: protein kinase [Planctomycetota bacterium]